MRQKERPRGQKATAGHAGKSRPAPRGPAPEKPVHAAKAAAGAGSVDWQAATAERRVTLRNGERPAERVPVILESPGAGDFHLIDSGNGQKLEQYGPFRIVRPEGQALWPPALPAHIWENADAVFTGDTDEDGMGRWRFPKAALGETWPLKLLDVDFLGRFTSFRHVGVFPEQIVHWSWMKECIETEKRPLKVLNLFGYTGVASLVAASAGAEVTHVDASKKAIGWARENQALARMEKLPVRWICDDAMKFIQREERRGSKYDIILTDPPKFGRGPNGEVWHLFEHLPLMLDICREILAPKALGLVLTAYSIRASFYSIHELMRETMRGCGGIVESGELVIREAGLDGKTEGRALSTSLFSRWVRA
ncbi:MULTISPECIES: class I SAM-dependent methyltransferase [unclassified Sinorhizobium]|uniref:class I SAM-dependent methyltransferase n=1 Tax=unclassified Sinorhizobium TaxID=2613772 RepID=UPI00352553A1